MKASLRHGIFLLLEILLRISVIPTLRAGLLRIFGADVGRNVRIYDCRFINLVDGFSNLHLGDHVHVGNGCLFDLAGTIRIKQGTTLSPRVTLISHSDAGSAHNSPIIQRYPCDTAGVEIGEYCWIGTNSTLLSGTKIGNETVLGAMSLVRGVVDAKSLYAGIPAKKIR